MKLEDILKIIDLKCYELVYIRSNEGINEVLAVVDKDNKKTRYDQLYVKKIQIMDNDYAGLAIFVERNV